MSVKSYQCSDKTQITPHFNAQEFRCKCGQNHDILISDTLVSKLETLRTALNCSKIILTSGYRCPSHDKNVGGTGGGQHTKGTAVDVRCYDSDGKIISSKLVCCTAQDLGFTGIANITSSYTSTHLDVRSSGKWYGDETKGTSTVTSDFYSYYGITKNSDSKLCGIDVSYAQGRIDWDKVKASGKVQFAILRAGYGKEYNQIDNQFERNYSECKRLEIPVGAYWYSYAGTAAEAEKEAEVCLKTVSGKIFEYPVYIDIEEKNQLNSTVLNAVANTFCAKVQAAGYATGLYCSTSFINQLLGSDFKYELWCAQYNKTNTCKFPYGIWQYGVAGHPEYDTFNTVNVPGVSGQCDLDYCYEDYLSVKPVTEQVETAESVLEEILRHVASIDNKL